MRGLRAETGVALPSALLVIVMIAVLAAGIWRSVDANSRSTGNHEESLKAIQIAEAGANHALAVMNEQLADTSYTRLLQGSDGLSLTADDGYLVGFGLDPALEIPASGIPFGEGSYVVRIVNDPADPTTDLLDTNDKVLLRCTGTTSRGGLAVVEAVIGEGAAPLPMIVVDGDATISGNPTLLGSCGAVHANGDLDVSGDVVVEEYVSATGDIHVSGSVKTPDGEDAPRHEGSPARDIPDHVDSTATHCDDADYVLQADGYIERTSDGALFDARSDPKFGWKRSGTGPTMWDYSSDDENPGTFCVHGNATVSGNPGESSGTPVPMSIIASGSIEISGNPLIVADDPNDYLLVSGGDVKIGGNPVGGAANYTGWIYARHQCDVSGNPVLQSQIQCKNRTSGSGVKNLVDENKFSGDMQNTYQCPSSSSGASIRSVLSWSQSFGS